MDIKASCRVLLKRSLLIKEDKRKKFLDLLDGMDVVECEKLKSILESENQYFTDLAARKQAHDPQGQWLKTLEDFLRLDAKVLVGELEAKEDAQDASQLEDLESELASV